MDHASNRGGGAQLLSEGGRQRVLCGSGPMFMTTVRDVMTTPVITVRPDTPLKEVARVLVHHLISGVPVVDDVGRVVGLISETDFLVKEGGPEAIHHRPVSYTHLTLPTIYSV